MAVSAGYILFMDDKGKGAKALLGNRIRSLRNIKGWTQQELGERADVNYKFIGEIERGQQNPSFAVLVKIAEALGAELQELFSFEKERLERKEIEKRLWQILESLSDEDLKRTLSVFEILYPLM